MKVHLLLAAALLFAGCGKPDDADEKDDEGPSDFVKSRVKLEFWGREVYTDNERYELGCSGIGFGFLIAETESCTAVTYDLDYSEEEDAMVTTVTDADKNFAWKFIEVSSAKVKINGTEYTCLVDGNKSYPKSAEDKYDGTYSHQTILTTKPASKPSELDETAVFAMFTNQAGFCKNLQ